MKIKNGRPDGPQGEFYFRALCGRKYDLYEPGSVTPSGKFFIEWSPTQSFYFSEESAKLANSKSEVLWPAEVLGNGCWYVPTPEEGDAMAPVLIR